MNLKLMFLDLKNLLMLFFKKQLPIWFKSYSAWALSIGTVFIGGWVSVFGSDIRKSTGDFISNLSHISSIREYQIDISTIIFWIFVILWMFFLFFHLQGEQEDERKKREKLYATIHRMPNFIILKNYRHEIFSQAIDILDIPLPGNQEPLEDRKNKLETTLQKGLVLVAQMASTFAQAEQSICYGANIMLLASPDDFCPRLTENLIFHEPTNIDALSAILYLPPKLRQDTTDADGLAHDYPIISLPVPKTIQDKDSGASLVLPGAPLTVMTGAASIYDDTSLLIDYCSDFSGPIRSQIREYFGRKGPARHIKSFASFVIGKGDYTLGVLNIDSERKKLLGEDPDFHPTFDALLSPIIHLMEKHIAEYAKLLWEEISSPAPSAGKGEKE